MHQWENNKSGHPKDVCMDVTCCIHRRGHAGCQKEKRHQRAGKNNPYQAFLVHLVNFLNLCISVNVNLNLKNVWRKSQAILARSIKFPDIFLEALRVRKFALIPPVISDWQQLLRLQWSLCFRCVFSVCDELKCEWSVGFQKSQDRTVYNQPEKRSGFPDLDT